MFSCFDWAFSCFDWAVALIEPLLWLSLQLLWLSLQLLWLSLSFVGKTSLLLQFKLKVWKNLNLKLATSDHLIDPGRSLSSSKRKYSLKFIAVWKGCFEDSWRPLVTFETAEETVCNYTTSCTKASQKGIHKLIGQLSVFNFGGPNTTCPLNTD